MGELTTRLKKKQRGFYRDPAPGFYDVKSTFDKAQAKAHGEAKLAGMRAALEKLGILNEVDPVAVMSAHFRGPPTPPKGPGRPHNAGARPEPWASSGPGFGGGSVKVPNAQPGFGGV